MKSISEDVNNNTNCTECLLVDTRTLQNMLTCGRDAATKLGYDAHASVRVGKRLLWNVERIKKYIDSISE